MKNIGVSLAVSEGYQSLSEIADVEAELDNSGLYRKMYDGNHVMYFPVQGEKYCIKRSTIWTHEAVVDSSDKAKNEMLIGNSLGRLGVGADFGNRLITVYDYKLSEKKGTDREGVYDVFLCTEKVSPLEQRDASGAVDICMAVCDLLEGLDGPHGNIHHQNVFLSGNDVVLGTCCLSGEKNDIIYYNAPEILRGERATEASDVYSLGVLLYSMLRATSENVFAEEDRYGIRDQDITVSSKVEGEVLSVIRKAVSCDPTERYANSSALKEALTKALKPKKKFPWKAFGITAAALLLLSGIGFYALRNFDPGARKIQSMISSGVYSLAYTEICARPSNEATDKLIVEYIEGCMEERDYQRAAQIIPEFSQEMFDSPEYLEKLFYTFRSKDKMSLLEPVFDRIYRRSDAIAEVIDRIR